MCQNNMHKLGLYWDKSGCMLLHLLEKSLSFVIFFETGEIPQIKIFMNLA